MEGTLDRSGILRGAKVFLGIAVLIIIGVVWLVVSGDSPSNTTAPSNLYEVVESWNDGMGEKILIPKNMVTESGMATLGLEIKRVHSGHQNAFVQVYTDRQAAALRDKAVAGTATKAEDDLYTQNYVGQYNKNGNTGLHEFNIFFDGVTGTNNKKITY